MPQTATLPAGLLRRLGDIPPERVRADPSPGTATEADLILLDGQKPKCELIDGTLVEMAAGCPESYLSTQIIGELGVYLKANRVGFQAGAGYSVRVGPRQVRAPDGAVVLWKAGEPRRVKSYVITDDVPELIFEIPKPSNTKAEIARKLAEFFAAGTLVAWVVDSQTGSAEIYTSATDKVAVPRDGVLTAEAVLPGFALPLAVVFEEGPDLDEPGARS